MGIPSFILSMARPVGSLLIGGVILWQVAEHSGSTKGRAIVHVATTGVEITVDDAHYRVETIWETPIVCELTPGRHTVRMLRGDRVLYNEEFTVYRGEEIILSAWDAYADGRSPGQND
jgi:hypothetical protein